MTSLVVLLSGTGSLFASLADACAAGRVDARITRVISDRPDAGGLDRARDRAIPTTVVAPGDFGNRSSWDEALHEIVRAESPDWIVSAGFMRILGPSLIDAYPHRIVNSHPALLPAFPGAHGVRDALAYGAKVTGCTIHLVDAGVDTGPILAQASVEISADDDESTLHERIKVVERDLLVDVIARLVASGCTVTDRRTTIP